MDRFNRIWRFTPILVACLVACDSPSSPSPLEDVESPLSESAIISHIAVLAADSLFGRQAGSEHELRAAQYIRGEFVEIGLEPGGDDYLQTFPMLGPTNPEGPQSQNVLGALPGDGSLAGQWIVVGAHYDHLGWRQVSADSVLVFNGADDNASGTALLIELARQLSAEADGGALRGDRRSVMFQAYGAEEIGLVGSNHFCSQPTVAMDSVVAMVNLDMVGRLRSNRLTLTGASSSEVWDELLSEANGGSLSFSIDESLMNRSDQSCFFALAKPVLLLHTGLHAEYHQPGDDPHLINRAGMLKVGNLAIGLVSGLATRPNAPSFQVSRQPAAGAATIGN